VSLLSLPALLWGQVGLLALGVLAAGIARWRGSWLVVYGTCFVLSSLSLAVALRHLLSGGHAELTVLPLGIPWMGAHFRLDGLSAFFLLVVDLGVSAASWYGLGYGRHEAEQTRVLPFFALFPAAMNLVVLADDAFTFLFAWELMSLVSWALVLANHRDPLNARAGYVYLVMASFGTLALLLAFGVLGGVDGAYVFDQMRSLQPTTYVATMALALTLIGAGSKAGVVPLHVWLPLAHPAAPSHVSALMSGVMTKVALYGFIRIVFDLMGSPTWWGGGVVLMLGGASAALGVLYALMQHDLKRLLAYHTVENIGIILIGLGLAMTFSADGRDVIAALAMTAALFHVLNHSLFKSLLFLGAGAVGTATGERDMERLGGLIHRMPRTALTFLVGSVAISALPPLNGFASEWLTFQAILLSPQLSSWTLRFVVPAVGALLALSAALAAACFVKAFGVTFLGRPRSTVAKNAREVDSFSVSAMLALATLCVVAGLFPGVIMDALAPVTDLLVGARLPVQATAPWLAVIPIAQGRSSYNALILFLFITASMLVTVLAIHRLASRNLRRSAAWDCGSPDASPATQYTAGSFAQPIRRVFGTLVFAAREKITMPPPGDMQPARMHVRMRDFIWEGLYAPVAHVVNFLARHLNRLQFLTIRKYLSLVFVLLIVLLLVLVVWH
jgi:hydrogenase-4 component B